MTSADPVPNPNAPLSEKVLVVAASWLVPGLGYLLKRREDWPLFLTNFLLLNGTFAVGMIAFRCPVLAPVWNMNSAEFSFINVLIFGGQLLAGWMAVGGWIGAAGDPTFLGGAAHLWQADLGSFYMVVAGAMNFFAIAGAYDRYYAKPLPQSVLDQIAARNAKREAAERP